MNLLAAKSFHHRATPGPGRIMSYTMLLNIPVVIFTLLFLVAQMK